MAIRASWLAVVMMACAPAGAPPPAAPASPRGHSVIVVVWDGLRPDAIDGTQALRAIRDQGVDFTQHHSTYPTFTMMNAASLATGDYPDKTGFFGNVLWSPRTKAVAAADVDFLQPVFTEDTKALDDLNAHDRVLAPTTLFEVAARAKLATVTVGKTGPAYLQDLGHVGTIFDEKLAVPASVGVALPKTGDQHKLDDGVSTDPTDRTGSPYQATIKAQIDAYLDHLLPTQPRLSVLWLRDPDTTEHNYGIGTDNWKAAIAGNDALLGALRDRLVQLGLDQTTDVIVMSDHGHSNVSGPQALFPLRAIAPGADGKPSVGAVDLRGHSVSGMIRLSDLLRRAGFTAYDGLDCIASPGMTGKRGDGSLIYPPKQDGDGHCKTAGARYQTPAAYVPAGFDPDHARDAVIVAVNGGSDYLYVPGHDPQLVARAVRFLQERSEIGAIFVDQRYASLPGTLPLARIHAQHAHSPDVIVSYDYDVDARLEGVAGTEMGGMLGGRTYRGMHGSTSPHDIHNVLVAIGPDFRRGFRDPLPSGNVDVAPTVAHLLGLALPDAEGRPLYEALVAGPALAAYGLSEDVAHPAAAATGLTVRLATSPDGTDVAPGVSRYDVALHVTTLRYGGQRYDYVDFAKATRN